MEWFEAIILGLLQGLTEFLPVSSSGHLAIGQALFGLDDGASNLAFTVLLHVATVCSTLVILWKEIVWIFKDLFAKQSWRTYSGLNDGTKFAINILISMIPIAIVGFCFKDKVEEVFGSGLLIVGLMLLVTAGLLAFSYFAKPRQKESLSGWHAFIIGIAQACAVMPGLSRSGSTIATGLLLGNKKRDVGTILLPYGHPAYLRRGLVRHKRYPRSGLQSSHERHLTLDCHLGFPGCLYYRLLCLQMDD